MDERKRWNHIRKLLERSTPFAHPDFEPSPDNLSTIKENVSILVVGAGGLGCELLKNLALLGFRKVDVIDMDTIDISNLNRQFLFRLSDVGKSKAEVATAFINKRVPGAKFTAHHSAIQDKDPEFYRKFDIIVCGLDSVVARRWMNGMLFSLIVFDADGTPDISSLKPMIDGGTEGFKGSSRVIIPTMTPCIECTLDLYPPQVNYPLCTIAQTPRLPEHCIEFARILLWPKEYDIPIDGDDPNHITWIYEKAVERASQFGISGVTYRLTQGVVKHIIPAVASTNAIIAGICSTEVFKIATSCYSPFNNYMVFNDQVGIFSFTYPAEKKDNCIMCSQKTQTLEFKSDVTLQQVINFLIESPEYQMKSPGITAMTDKGMKTLYMQAFQATKDNLKKSLKELRILEGGEIMVADVTTPNAINFLISYNDSC